MSLIAKKDLDLLLGAGFSEEDLGLMDGGKRGIEIYETPDDYFAHEIIDNAKEQGQVDLYDEPKVMDTFKAEPQDNSHKGVYDDHEYDGNEDWLEDVPINLREQATWLKEIKLGRMSVWQRRNKKGIYEWQVKGLRVRIPEEDLERYNRLSKEEQKILWITYAKDEWKKLWQFATYSLRFYPMEEKIEFTTKKGQLLKMVVISANNVREAGYNNLPENAEWITIIYFDKEKNIW